MRYTFEGISLTAFFELEYADPEIAGVILLSFFVKRVIGSRPGLYLFLTHFCFSVYLLWVEK